MKFNGLKFMRNGIAIITACSFMIACMDESGNNSTTGNGSKPSESATSPASTDTKPDVKKSGKASVSSMTRSNNEKMKKDEMGYYNYTEVLPEYNGGQHALESYINENIEYPQDAIDNSVEGTVHVQFVVDEKGHVSDVKTAGNKIGYGLEEEAVRVVSNMPKWSPGQVKGKYVKTRRTLPIIYRLES